MRGFTVGSGADLGRYRGSSSSLKAYTSKKKTRGFSGEKISGHKIMEELEHYLEGNPHLSKNSKRAYTHAYQKIMTVTPKMIKNIPQGELISKIENLSASPNSFNQSEINFSM